MEETAGVSLSGAQGSGDMLASDHLQRYAAMRRIFRDLANSMFSTARIDGVQSCHQHFACRIHTSHQGVCCPLMYVTYCVWR